MKIKFLILVSLVSVLAACSTHAPKPLQLISLEELAQLEQEQATQVAGTSQAEPGQLILNQPQQAESYASQSSVTEKGPEIKILQPLLSSTVTNPLSVHVEFASRQPNATVNMKSLKLTYKKFWGIDLTDRIIDYIEGESINAPEVELPAGQHTLEIYIEDDQENQSTKLITVVIAES